MYIVPLGRPGCIHVISSYRKGCINHDTYANILAKVSEPIDEVNAELLLEPAEIALNAALDRSRESLAAAVSDNDFPEALNQLALLRSDVDSFFDTVLVNAEDKAVRLNRLALLQELRAQFLKVADLAVLAR